MATPGGPALRDAFAGIAEELGHQYTISFRPLNRTHDGKWRALEVKVAREGASVRTEKRLSRPQEMNSVIPPPRQRTPANSPHQVLR